MALLREILVKNIVRNKSKNSQDHKKSKFEIL